MFQITAQVDYAAAQPVVPQARNINDRRIFVGGLGALPKEVTESDLKQYFSTFGTVAQVAVRSRLSTRVMINE